MAKTGRVRWRGGLTFELDGDALDVLEGTDGRPGARPMDALLVALAACTGMDVISILGKKRQVVEGYVVEAVGEQQATHPKTFASIVVEHRLGGAVLAPDAVRRAVELSATRYCPVNAHLSAGTAEIVHRYVIERTGEAERAEVARTGPLGAGLEPTS